MTPHYQEIIATQTHLQASCGATLWTCPPHLFPHLAEIAAMFLCGTILNQPWMFVSCPRNFQALCCQTFANPTMKLIRMEIRFAPNVTRSGLEGEKLLTFFSIGALADIHPGWGNRYHWYHKNFMLSTSNQIILLSP